MPSLSRRVSVALRGTDLGWRYLYNAAPSLAFKPGALSAEQARIVAGLNQNGIAITSADKLLGSSPLFSELDGAVANIENGMAAHLDDLRRGADGATLDSKAYLCEVLGEKPKLDPESIFGRFALDSVLLDVANAYFGMYTRMRGYNVWHNFKSKLPARQSQLWHRDREDRLILKVFVYLSDVFDGAGPFTYAPGTHKKGAIQQLPEFFNENGVKRSTDEQMGRVVPADKWIKADGPKGTIVFADTHGYHKGGEARTAERLLYNCMYTSPASESRELMIRAQSAYRFPDVARTVALAPSKPRFWLSLPETARS